MIQRWHEMVRQGGGGLHGCVGKVIEKGVGLGFGSLYTTWRRRGFCEGFLRQACNRRRLIHIIFVGGMKVKNTESTFTHIVLVI